MEEDRLLRLPEVSARLSLSRTAIYRLMARGELLFVHVGGALRFPASSLDQMIAGLKSHADTGKEDTEHAA